MFEFALALIIIWLSAHLTRRHLIQEAGTMPSVLVAFAFTLLAPIIHLFLAIFAAALFGTGFSPQSWFEQIPLIASAAAIITYLTVRSRSTSRPSQDGHIERKF
jgi:hypothetical protein